MACINDFIILLSELDKRKNKKKFTIKQSKGTIPVNQEIYLNKSDAIN